GRELRAENSVGARTGTFIENMGKPLKQLDGIFNTGAGIFERIKGFKKEIPMSENAKEILSKAMERHATAMSDIRGKIDIQAAVDNNYDRERDHKDAESLRTMRDKTGKERREGRAAFQPGVKAAENLKPTLENEREETQAELEQAKLDKQLFRNLSSRKKMV
ncbi:hypothetical protein KKF63_07760, partial [bacterium]|nr:hypothetical protein [bacterium]